MAQSEGHCHDYQLPVIFNLFLPVFIHFAVIIYTLQVLMATYMYCFCRWQVHVNTFLKQVLSDTMVSMFSGCVNAFTLHNHFLVRE